MGKKEREQVKLVNDWNKVHKIGTDVIVTMDDKKEMRTKTISLAVMLGEFRAYPGHTAVIFLEGISGCYMLERVRPA